MLGLLDAFDDILVEPFVPDGAVVALDVGVLLGLTGLDVLDGYSQFLGPDQQLSTDVFRAVVDPYRPGFATPLDNSVQTADDPENLSSWALNPDAIFPAPVKERLQRNLKEFRYQIS